MLATKIPAFLKKLYSNESRFKTVLLDGKWGCGKTYGIELFVNDKKGRPNCIYISLFGAKTVNDIVLKLAEKLESKYIVEMGDDYYVADSPYDMDYNNTLIIFDDLERVSEDLKYESLYGVVDSLRKNGFKIVCVACYEEANDKKRFLQFREKTFDTVINISGDPSAFSKILPKLGLESCEAYLKIADSNWRLLIKASTACLEIIDFMNAHKKGDFLKKMELDNSTFFRCVLLAEKCIFSKNDTIHSFSNNDYFGELSYDEDVEEFGVPVANELYSISKSEDRVFLEQVKKFVRSILVNDYYQLIYQYYPNTASGILNEPPFNDEPRYLGDEEKESFKAAFFKRIREFDFNEEIQVRFLINFLNVFAATMTKKEMDLLSTRVAETVPSSKSSLFSNMMYLSGGGLKDKIDYFKNQIDKLFFEKEERATKALLNKAFKNGDYSTLTDFLYKKRINEPDGRMPIAEMFSEKGFFLPDLSKSINYLIWQYCLEIATFVSDLGDYSPLFVECLKKQCESSPSRTLRQRCNELAVAKGLLGSPKDFFDIKPISGR